MADSPPKFPVTLRQSVPSVDRVLNMSGVAALAEIHGRQPATEAVRAVIDASRAAIQAEGEAALAGLDEGALTARIAAHLEAAAAPSLRPVFNLTGTVLHTNLGRAPLPDEAIAAMTEAAGAAKREQTLVLQEKLPLLGEEQAEPGQIDLLCIHLNLGEIRIVGQIHGQTWSQTVFHIDSCLRIKLSGFFATGTHLSQIDGNKGFHL